MPLALWSRSSRKSLPTNVQRVFSGYNGQDSFEIKDTFATDMQNVTSKNFPIASTRPGYSLSGAARAAKILGLGVWKQTELAVVANGEWFRNIAGSYTSLKSGLSTVANYSFSNFDGNLTEINLIGANGVDAVQRYNGTTVQNLANAPAAANFIETYADRLWCVTAGNQLNFSEYRVADNWTTLAVDSSDPGFITIETNDGENISAVKVGSQRLVIFKPNSMFDLFGTSSEDFTLIPKSGDVGAVSNQAVTTIGSSIYFVHSTGVFVYNGGARPEKDFSAPVQNLIDRINPAAITKCCAGTDGKMLYLGIPLDSATECDTILEFNTQYGTWCIWKGFAPLNITIMKDVAYIGGVDGTVRKVGGLTTDNGTAISGYLISKPMTAGSLSQKLMLKRAWLTTTVPTGSTLNVGLSKSPSGNSDFTTVASVLAENAVSSSSVIVPTTTVAFANWIRYKISFTGPVDVLEYATELEELPIR